MDIETLKGLFPEITDEETARRLEVQAEVKINALREEVATKKAELKDLEDELEAITPAFAEVVEEVVSEEVQG